MQTLSYTPPTKRIGMLTPSSNTVLEPMVARILAEVPDVSAHVSRLPVTEISLGDASKAQFARDRFLAASALLVDARVDVIGWNGTSASWNGFDRDTALCQEIAAGSGIAATSAVLAINELLDAFDATEIGLVTPYVADVQNRIIANYERNGTACVAHRHFDETVNYAFAEIGDDRLETAMRQVAEARPKAIVIMCTNLAAAHLAAPFEAEFGIPVIDSISAFVWKSLTLCGADTSAIRGWGRLFEIDGGAK